MQLKREQESYQTTKVFFWDGILDPKGLTESYTKVIDLLIEGNLQGLDLEKLAGHNIYSVRINKSDRLLFTTITVNGKPYLLLLDEVLNHDYAKSRFLKPAVLKHYLELHGNLLSEEIISEHFEACNKTNVPLPKPIKSNQLTQFFRINFYNQKFIELDDIQMEAATSTSLPIIIKGVAGSGKSCIALLILEQYVKSNIGEYPILYITESQGLADTMKNVWQATPVAQGIAPNAVQFLSYEELIQKLMPQTVHLTFVGKEHCQTWLSLYIKQNKKHPLIDASFASDIDKLYQEFRIISGCNDFETYLTLGERQSLFHSEHEKKWLFEAFDKYQQELEDTKSIHAPFYPLALKDQFHRIVVDEAQDLSPLQLQKLAALAVNRDICFCEDDRQSLSDNKSKIPFITHLMYSWGIKILQITLNASYRCPNAVIRMANAVSGLKSIVTGAGQPPIVASEQANQGTVQWFDAFTDEQLSAMKQAAASPDFAIVTLKEYKEEAKKRFNTPLVFTADEIKGLEYKFILAYRLLDAPLFKEANTLIGEQSCDFKTTSNRPKKDQGQEQFGPLFNGLYTACTRALDTLYIFQKQHHSVQHLCSTLLKAISDEQQKIVQTTATNEKQNSEEWFNQVKMHLGQGTETLAKDIYLQKLNQTAAEFEQFKKQFLMPAAQQREDIKQDKKISLSSEPKTATPGPVRPGKTKKITQPTPRTTRQSHNRSSAAPTPHTIIKSVGNSADNKVAVPAEITKLLKNLTKNTLSKFLTMCTKKKKQDFLFKIPLDGGACLFTRLFDRPDWIEALISCMPDHLMFFSKHLTEDALCRARTEAGEYTNTSPLFGLSIGNDGNKILNSLLDKNPNIARFITPEALCLPLTSASSEYANESPLYWLSYSSEGLKILNILLTQNPNLAARITPEALCLVLTSGADANTSPLYCLSATIEGKKTLGTLLEKNPNIYERITPEALCLTLSSGSGEDANTSPLYWLSESIDGLKILDTLLNRNPSIIEQITPEILCLAQRSDTYGFSNSSTLYWLSHSAEGLKILNTLIDKKPNFAERITAKALCLSLTPTTGILANTSPLYWLSENTAGRKTLYTLLEKNPNLAEQITPKALCLSKPSNGSMEANTSPLYWLSHSADGHKILEILLAKNSNLATLITPEALCLTRTSEAGVFTNTSALYWLSASTDGQKILSGLIAQNPNISEGITSEALCLSGIDFDGKPVHSSPLNCLFKTTEGQNIIDTLRTRNQKLDQIIKETKLNTSPLANVGFFSNSVSATLKGSDDYNLDEILATLI